MNATQNANSNGHYEGQDVRVTILTEDEGIILFSMDGTIDEIYSNGTLVVDMVDGDIFDGISPQWVKGI